MATQEDHRNVFEKKEVVNDMKDDLVYIDVEEITSEPWPQVVDRSIFKTLLLIELCVCVRV